MTAEELKMQGITDFQLDYAVKLVSRLGARPVAPAQVASATK